MREIPGLIEMGILEGFSVGDDYRSRVSSVESITGPLAAEFLRRLGENDSKLEEATTR
jgi:hypothetical protein